MSASPLKPIAILCLTALLTLFLALRYDPQKPHARWLRHGICGLFALVAWNLLPLPNLGINPLSAIITGSLGLPGAALLAVASALK